jgi:hypothetical protein
VLSHSPVRTRYSSRIGVIERSFWSTRCTYQKRMPAVLFGGNNTGSAGKSGDVESRPVSPTFSPVRKVNHGWCGARSNHRAACLARCLTFAKLWVARLFSNSMQSNNMLERTVKYRGRIVLAMDCVLGKAQWQSWLAAQLGR